MGLGVELGDGLLGDGGPLDVEGVVDALVFCQSGAVDLSHKDGGEVLVGFGGIYHHELVRSPGGWRSRKLIEVVAGTHRHVR